MTKSDRSIRLSFRVSPGELRQINEQKEFAGVRSMSAYLRRMALWGYCLNLDLSEVRDEVSLLRRCSNNLNQYAKRANETGSIYEEDIKDLQGLLDKIWENQNQLLAKLSEINQIK